jgi:16S rRNA G527 N7-methylase RsmG
MIELPNGELIEQELSTTGLNKEQFSEYVERVTAWAMDHSVTHVTNDTTMLA